MRLSELCRAIAIVTVFASLLTALPLSAATPKEELATQVPQARGILDQWQAQEAKTEKRLLRIVYWTPSDREPAPRYQERLSKIFHNIREYYAREMERNGFGRRTFNLEEEKDGLIKIHLVRSAQVYTNYNVASGRAIRAECVPVLREAGLNADKETIVIFCNMSNWDAEKRTISQNSPYYALGTHLSGNAWQVDSPILDLDGLKEREAFVQDKQYGKISLGRYNSIFIGGIAHELGHGLGLPHNQERPDQRAEWGTALMGSGNRTYGEQLRGEGKGSFLTLAHALRLASHPLFCGSVKGAEIKPNARLSDIRIEAKEKGFIFSARVMADPPAYAVIGYADPEGNSDYNATTCTAVPDAEGRFTLECNALALGKPGVLRVVVAQANGAMNFEWWGVKAPSFPYTVSAEGSVDLSPTNSVNAATPGKVKAK